MSSKNINEKPEENQLENAPSDTTHTNGKTQPDPSLIAAVATSVEDYEQLLREAKIAYRREAEMSFKQAIKTYPKAVAWSLILSTAIIMEGYDTSLLGEWMTCEDKDER